MAEVDDWITPDAPKAPAGADDWVTTPADHPEEKPATFANKALEPITSYPEEFRRQREGSAETVKEGVKSMVSPSEVGPVGTAKSVWNLGKTLAGALGYVTSPITAGLRTTVGKPIEETTGSPFLGSMAEGAAGLAIPGYGMTRLPSKAIPSVPASVVGAVEEARAALAKQNLDKAGQFKDAQGRPMELSYGEAAQDPHAFHLEDMAEQGAYGKPAQDVAVPIQRERFDVMHGASQQFGHELGGARPDVTNPQEAARVVEDEMRQHAERIAQTRRSFEQAANREEQAQTGMLEDQQRALSDIIRGRGEEAGSARDTGEMVGNAVRQRATEARAGVGQAYERAFELPGEIHAGAFEGVGTRIKGDLTFHDDPVIIDDVTTPVASRAIQHLDKSIDQLRIQNRADPMGQPNPENITAVNLRGVDQLRKQLNRFYAAARGGQNPSDARAMGRIIHAFDDQVESAVAGNLFSGDPRALQALRDARGAYRNYVQTFRPQGAGDDVGNAMRRIIDRGATPEEVSRMVVGSGAIGNAGLPVRLARRLEQIFGRDSHEWSAVRQSMWQQASTGAANAQKTAQNIERFANSSLGRQVFAPEELAAMRNHAQAMRALEQTITASPIRQQAERFAEGYERFFSGRDIGGSPGQTLRKIAEGRAQPEEIINTVFRAIGGGKSGDAARMVDAIGALTGRESPSFQALRQGAWQTITQKALGADRLGPQKLSQDIFQFIGSPVAKKLYSPEELKRMREFAEVVKLKTAPPKSKTNPSGTASSLATMARRAIKFAPIATHALLGAHLGPAGNLAAHGINGWLGRFATGAEEAAQAAKVKRSLSGMAPDEQRASGGRVDGSHLGEADEAMGLNKQEGDLYRRHVDNLWGKGGVDNPDGSRSSLYQAVVEHNGRYYNIPTVRDGRILPIPQAEDAAHDEGIDKFPSYSSPEEADARYDQMHGFMEKDTANYFNQARARGGRAMADGGDPEFPDDPGSDPTGAQDAAERAAARVRAPYARAEARESGLPSLLSHYGEKVKNVLTAPQDALEGRLQVNDPETNMPTPQAMQRANEFAGTVMGGGMPMAERGALGMAGGMPTYSAAGEAARNAKLQVGTPDQWLGYLKNQPGVKAQELEHAELEPWLKSRPSKVTRDEVDQYIESKQPRVQEIRKGEDEPQREQWRRDAVEARIRYGMNSPEYEEVMSRALPSSADTKYPSYQLPGGSNYGETLLTLPNKSKTLDQIATEKGYGGWGGLSRERMEEVLAEQDKYGKPSDQYQSSHWDEPNVLLHVRHNDRTVPGPNGEPLNSLHLEELQSDWHQAGRKQGYKQKTHEIIPETQDGIPGYNVNGEWFASHEHAQNYQDKFKEGVPDAPFKQTWPDLGLKRMLYRAATETNPDGTPKYHALSWTPGEAQAARYDLSKHLDSIGYEKRGNLYNVAAYPKKGNSAVWQKQSATLQDIENNLGKEMAEKISKGHGREEGKLRYLEDLDLKVGGEGMKAFYDKMLVDKANALTKKYGAKVKQSTVDENKTNTRPRYGQNPNYTVKHPVHVLRITPELRAAATKGFPTFASGGRAMADGGDPGDDQLPPIRPMIDAGAEARKRPVLSFDLYPKREPEGPSPKVPSPDFIAPPPGLRQEPDRLPEGMTYERPPGVLSPNASRSVVAGAVEPFGQAGRLIQGASEDPSSDLASVGAAIAPIGPPGVAKALGQSAKTAARSGAERITGAAIRRGSIPINRDMVPFTTKGIENGTTAGTKAAGLPGRGELPGGSGVLATPGRPDLAGGAVSAEPLVGLPRKVAVPGQPPIEAAPFIPARQAAVDYAQTAGLPYNPPRTYAKVEPERAARIAQAFEEMPHDPTNPEVQSAYKAMIDETMAQWNAIKKTGLQVDFMPPGVDYYAASPRLATEDVRRNNHLWVFSTKEGFGSGETISPDSVMNNPLLAPTGETISGQPALANDIFRAVHDYFGHIKEGVGFRADGEENAWRSHSAMYTPQARRAMTTETRGQNSWLNYGPHGEVNRTARTEDTKFADQKIGLLPDWAVNEGAGDPVTSPAISSGRQLQPGTKEFNKAAQQAKAEIAAQGKGAGPLDLSSANEIPGTPQAPLERYDPPRGVSPRLTEALQNKNVMKGVERSVKHGVEEYGAEKWYHTEPIRRAFVDELGPEQGMEAFDKYMHMVAATSPRSDAGTNVRNASFYYNKMMQGEPLTKKNPAPYGHMAQALHNRMARNIIDAYKAHNLGAAAKPDPWDLMANPKPASFQANLTGNLEPGTMDTHAFRNIGMRTADPRFLATSLQVPIKGASGPESMVSRYGEVGGSAKKPMAIYRPQQLLKEGRLSMQEALKIPSFWSTKPNPNEYAAAEQLYAQIGKKLGMPTADAQAAAWAGAGKMTGLETPPTHTFPELFNERVLFTSKMRGEEPQTTLRRFIRGEAPLLSVGGLLAIHNGDWSRVGEEDKKEKPKRASGGRIPLSTRTQSNYSAAGGRPDHHCGPDRKWPEGFCAKFRGPHSCVEVGGFIAAHGRCDWYKRVPQGRATGGRVLSHYVDLNPTEAQKAAGNYRKAHITLHGLGIAIENPKGTKRHGVGHDGKPWSVDVPASYGYIKGFIGRDKDHVDVYVGPYTKSKRAWVVEQHDEKSGSFDEHKVFLGFGSEDHVRKTYAAGFSDGRAKDRLGRIHEMTIDELKSWLHSLRYKRAS